MISRRGSIVVTGGAGFIGSHLVRRLAGRAPRDIVVFDRRAHPRDRTLPRAPHVRYVSGDIRDESAVVAALQGATIVFHLAAVTQSGARPYGDDDVFHSNVAGTFNVLSAARRLGVRRIVFTSSWEVYGEPAELPVVEDHPLLALGTAGASKVAAEAYCRAFRRERGVETTILRLADVYGAGDTTGSIAQWIAQAVAGETLDVAGDLTSDFISVGFVVEALVRAAALKHPAPPINVGSGTGIRQRDLAQRIAMLAGGHSHVRILPMQATRARRFVAGTDRMRDLLGIEPPLDPTSHLDTLIPSSPATRAASATPPPSGGRLGGGNVPTSLTAPSPALPRWGRE